MGGYGMISNMYVCRCDLGFLHDIRLVSRLLFGMCWRIEYLAFLHGIFRDTTHCGLLFVLLGRDVDNDQPGGQCQIPEFHPSLLEFYSGRLGCIYLGRHVGRLPSLLRGNLSEPPVALQDQRHHCMRRVSHSLLRFVYYGYCAGSGAEPDELWHWRRLQ